MVPAASSRLRAQVVGVVVAGVLIAIGAAIWANVATGNAGGADDTIRLDEPGEWVLDSAVTNPSHADLPLPAVELEDVDGHTVALETDGRPMVVNLWFADCPPCARELADFAAVHEEVGERIRFVGVNPLDSPKRMGDFAAARGVAYELLRDPGAELADELHVAVYPVTLLVDADGTIVEQTGAIDAAELRRRIEALW